MLCHLLQPVAPKDHRVLEQRGNKAAATRLPSRLQIEVENTCATFLKSVSPRRRAKGRKDGEGRLLSQCQHELYRVCFPIHRQVWKQPHSIRSAAAVALSFSGGPEGR